MATLLNFMTSMKATSHFREICQSVANNLGHSLKDIQKDVHSNIVRRHDILPYFLQSMTKAFVMPAYPEHLIRL